MNRIILAIALISSFNLACGGDGEPVTVAEQAPSTAAAVPIAGMNVAAATTAAAASTGKSIAAPAGSAGKSAGVPGTAMAVGSAPGGFTVGSTVSCNWQDHGMYFSATIERVNGDNLSVLYADGDREDTTVSKCRLGSAGSIDGEFNAAMQEAAAEVEAALEELGEDWAEDFEDEMEEAMEEMEDAMEELEAAFEDLDF